MEVVEDLYVHPVEGSHGASVERTVSKPTRPRFVYVAGLTILGVAPSDPLKKAFERFARAGLRLETNPIYECGTCAAQSDKAEANYFPRADSRRKDGCVVGTGDEVHSVRASVDGAGRIATVTLVR